MNFRQLILSNIKKTKKLFAEFMFCFILASCALSINPYVTSRIIGCFNLTPKDKAIEGIIFWLIVFIIAKSLQALNQYFFGLTSAIWKGLFQSNISLDLFKMVHAHQNSYFDDEMTGRISSAINSFSGKLSDLMSMLTFSFLRPLINYLFAFTIIATTSPRLALTLTILCLPFFFAIKKLHNKFFALAKKRGKLERHYDGLFTDSITNYKLVRYTGSIFTEKLNLYKHLKKYLRATVDFEMFHIFSRTFFHLGETAFSITSYAAILYFTAIDSISLADAFFAFSSVFMFSQSVQSLNGFAQHFSETYGDLISNFELINKPITIKDKPNALNLKIKKATITYQNISFSYTKEKPIFTDLTLKIPAGQKVGLVGLSGAGKSTLINLLLRSYLPQSGKILINKFDIADITETSLHKNISYVPQDVTLFNRSLYENLKIANPKATQEEIIKAAQMASIHNTITELDDGYDSIVGERGILLSGGERQRIAIARAILQNAPILILDEATSALDSEAEIMVQNALENLMKNKTVIAIAHRLSTLRAMDRIIVLDNGKIIEDGPLHQLLNKKDGLFKQLYSLQTDGYLASLSNPKEGK